MTGIARPSKRPDAWRRAERIIRVDRANLSGQGASGSVIPLEILDVILATLQGSPPILMFYVPANGLLQSRLEVSRWSPTQRLESAGVDTIADIVSRPV